MIDPTNGVRALGSTNRPAAKLVFLYLAEQVFKHVEASPVKVRSVAAVLELKPRTVRHAVRELVDAQLLTCVEAPTGGTPGVYRLGATAHRPTPLRDDSSATRAGRRAPKARRPTEPEATEVLPND